MASLSTETTIADQLREQAKALARNGFRVFPLEVDGNTPAHEGWRAQATQDELTADRLWRDPFDVSIPYNIGIATGNGLTVLDVDVKNGQPGLESLDELVTFLGLDDETFTVRTRSGGLHLYFNETKYALKNSASLVRPGLDIRSDGGYVVGPGSTTNGLEYVVEQNRPMKPMPAWFAEMCGRRGEKGADTSQPLVELDTHEAIARAVQWLKQDAPETIADSGTGDHTAYKVACRVKDFGVSEGECMALILEHYDPARCHPPQGHEIWETKVSNAYRHGLSAPGVKHPMADFEVVELEQPESAAPKPAKKPRLYLVKGYDSRVMLQDYDRRFLVDDLLDAGAMSVMYGDSHAGKTFVMLDIALHVAAGLPWNGHEVKKSPVVYIAAEGTFGIHARVTAWAKHNGVDMADVWFSTLPCPVDLLRPDGDLKELVAIVKEDAASWGDGKQPPGLVVIDTMSRALAGGDENSSVDVGALVRNVDTLRAATGAHQALVHHSGKDAARGARGWSGLRAATDTEIEIRDKTLSVTKQREGVAPEPREFVLQTVELGVDKRGKPIASAVPLYGAAAEMAGPEPLTKEQARWLDDLTLGVEAMASEAGIPASEFRFKWQNAAAMFTAKDLKRTSIEKRLSALAAKGVLVDCKQNQWLIALPPHATS